MKRLLVSCIAAAVLFVASVAWADTLHQLNVTPSMIASDATFSYSGSGVSVATPIPYGTTNNVEDNGWILAGGGFTVDFAQQTALEGLRAWSVYRYGGRSADWNILYSDNGTSWTSATTFHYTITSGGGATALASDGSYSGSVSPNDFSGWYGVDFNNNGAIQAQYWRVEFVSTTSHSPRTAEIKFLGTQVPEPGTLILLTTGLLGALAYAWRKRWARHLYGTSP